MKRIGICLAWIVLNSSSNSGAADLFTQQELLSLAAEQYQQVLSSTQVVEQPDKDAETVQRVADRINTAVKAYYKEHKQSGLLKNFSWETKLINKKLINAFCLPGARTIIGTGMLDWAQNEGSLAVVYAHELTHVLLGHGEERLRTALQEMMDGKKLSELLSSSSRAADAKDIFLAAFGARANVGLLPPFSLDQEMETDRLAMIFAALAGYNPRETIVFWERMGKLANGPRQPVLMTVHPAPAGRIAKMQQIVDGLIRKYFADKTG